MTLSQLLQLTFGCGSQSDPAAKRNFHITLSQQDFALLSALGDDTKSTDSTQVIRDALRWYKFTVDETMQGREIVSRDPASGKVFYIFEVPDLKPGAGKVTPFPNKRT